MATQLPGAAMGLGTCLGTPGSGMLSENSPLKKSHPTILHKTGLSVPDLQRKRLLLSGNGPSALFRMHPTRAAFFSFSEFLRFQDILCSAKITKRALKSHKHLYFSYLHFATYTASVLKKVWHSSFKISKQ
jgi:hypothetical protein